MALAVMALVEMFSLLGFEWTMVRHPDPRRAHFDTAFTLQLIFSTAASAIIVLLAHPFAAYYRTPELAPIIMVMALGPLLWGLNISRSFTCVVNIGSRKTSGGWSFHA